MKVVCMKNLIQVLLSQNFEQLKACFASDPKHKLGGNRKYQLCKYARGFIEQFLATFHSSALRRGSHNNRTLSSMLKVPQG